MMSGTMRPRIVAGLASFALCAAALALTLATFPWKRGDSVGRIYVVAVAVGSAALTWGIALVVPRWRRFSLAVAAVTTVYAGLLAWVFTRQLPG